MTSPHAASEEVVASTATIALDDSPTNVHLTAAENASLDATIAARLDAHPQGARKEEQTAAQEVVPPIDELHISELKASTPVPDAVLIPPQTPPAQIKTEITVKEAAIPETPGLSREEADYVQATLDGRHTMASMAEMVPYGGMGEPDTLNVPTMNSAMADLSASNMGYNNDLMNIPPYHDAQSPYITPNDETRISAYALLEFEDGQFYMNTYSVILGRDLAAARAALRRDAELARIKQEEEEQNDAQTPLRIKREGSKSRYTRSIISEGAGILREGDDSDSDDRARRRKKASKKTKSTGSTSRKASRRPSLVQPNEKIDYQPQLPARRHQPETAGAVPVDPRSLRPSPHDCPIVGIHPPADTPASGYKAISRQHVKIAYNSKKSLFEAEIIGRNGAFVDDIFYYHQDVIPLKSGSYLQIGGVVVRFVLPDVAIGETGAEPSLEQDGTVRERYVEDGKEMSFDFEDATRDGVLLGDSSDEESNIADIPQPGIEGNDDDGENSRLQEQQQQIFDDDDDDDDLSSLSEPPSDEEEGGYQAVEESKPVQAPVQTHQQQQERNHQNQHQQLQQSQQQLPMPQQQPHQEHQRTGLPDFQHPPMMPQKKRGPGRPPKNGIMSKREQQEMKKEAQQRALQEALALQPELAHSLSGKNKVGRPRKNPMDEIEVKTEKRKYTKRKPKDPDAPSYGQPGSGDENGFGKPKEKKSTKPPRSPSPTFNEADLTPEQLAKPQANYVTLIHEALSNSPTGQMSLPQIYRAIQRRYPFFVLKCNTNGWQSSVRHNLSQHHAFRKVERDGKGWMWAIVNGVSIEKEKKRRPTPPHQLPPHMQHQPIYRAGPPHMMPGHPGMMPPPGFMHPGMPPHLRPGQPYMGQPMNGYAMPGLPPPHMNGHAPPGYPPVMPMGQPLAAPAGTYSSPYAPKPPANTANPQQTMQPPINMQPQGPPLAQAPHYQPQAPRPIQQAPPQSTEDKRNQLIETFRATLTKNLSSKTAKADAIVSSAIKRVTGNSSQSTVATDPQEHKMEEQIMIALQQMLAKFPAMPQQAPPQPPPHLQQQGPQHGVPIAQGTMQQQQGQPQMQQAFHQQPAQQQPLQPQPSTQQNQAYRQPAVNSPQMAPSTQHSLVEGAAKPAAPIGAGPPVQRPSFSGQSRPLGPAVPRPPMMTPGMSRTGSQAGNTPARTSASASPAIAAATPGSAVSASAETASVAPTPAESAPANMQNDATAQGQIVNQGMVPNPSPAIHPISLSSQPQSVLQAPVAQDPVLQGQPEGHNTADVPAPRHTQSNSPSLNENGKRPLEGGGDAEEGSPDLKKINASGPPALKA